MVAISLTPDETVIVYLNSLVGGVVAPLLLAARVLANRMDRPEHLRLALQAAWLDIKFTIHAGMDNPKDNLFIFEFEKLEDSVSVLRLGLWSFDNRIMMFELLKPRDQIYE